MKTTKESRGINPRKLIIGFIMLIYGSPALAIMIIDGLDHWSMFRHQPGGMILVLCIGSVVVLLGSLMWIGETKEDKRYDVLPLCGICGLKMERSINCGGDCLFCMADCGDPDAVKTVSKIARKVYLRRPAYSQFNLKYKS